MPNHYLKQRDNGTWYIHWTDANRRPQKASTGTKDEAQAQKELDQFVRDEAASALPDAGASIAVAQAWKIYVDRHAAKRSVSLQAIESCWVNLGPFFGHQVVGDVRGLIEPYITMRQRVAKRGTIRKELIYMLAALNFCSQPYHGLKLFPPELIDGVLKMIPKGSPPRDRWLRPHEVDALLQAAMSFRTGPQLARVEIFIWLALETAGRVQALLDLTWDRVDFDNKSIHLALPDRDQTSKFRPSVPISKTLMPVLRRADAERTDKRPNALVLGSSTCVWGTVQLCVVRAGLGKQGKAKEATGISPHTFRHTAATQMARRGVPLFKIAKILGNSVRMVEQTYAKYQLGDLQDAIDTVSEERLRPVEVERTVQLRTV